MSDKARKIAALRKLAQGGLSAERQRRAADIIAEQVRNNPALRQPGAGQGCAYPGGFPL